MLNYVPYHPIDEIQDISLQFDKLFIFQDWELTPHPSLLIDLKSKGHLHR